MAVKEATLFYRPLRETEYSQLSMTPQGDDIYSATIPEAEVWEPAIEYYVQASDEAGNVALQGFSFDPLIVAVASVIPPIEEEVASVEEEAVAPEEPLFTTGPSSATAWYKKWWVWTIGVAVVGGAVAVAGGGGGGDDGDGASTGGLAVAW